MGRRLLKGLWLMLTRVSLLVFQIPVTQASLMEDIEQWLSTDVVRRPHP